VWCLSFDDSGPTATENILRQMKERSMREVTIPDVKKAEVGGTVQNAVDAGATKIEATPNENGTIGNGTTWTVVTTFPR